MKSTVCHCLCKYQTFNLLSSGRAGLCWEDEDCGGGHSGGGVRHGAPGGMSPRHQAHPTAEAQQGVCAGAEGSLLHVTSQPSHCASSLHSELVLPPWGAARPARHHHRGQLDQEPTRLGGGQVKWASFLIFNSFFYNEKKTFWWQYTTITIKCWTESIFLFQIQIKRYCYFINSLYVIIMSISRFFFQYCKKNIIIFIVILYSYDKLWHHFLCMN